MRKPTFTKGYVAVFVSLSIKALHLEPATELTTRIYSYSAEIHLPQRDTIYNVER